MKDQELRKDSGQNGAQAALRDSDSVNPRYNLKAVKDKLEELKPKPIRNQMFFNQKQGDIPDGFLEEYNDEYTEEEEDEQGKWKGRNKNEDENNVAIEEEDEPLAGKDDIVLEDVGGQAFKKKKNKKRQAHPEMKMEIIEKNDDNLMKVNDHIGLDQVLPLPEEVHDFDTGARGQLAPRDEEQFVVQDLPDMDNDLDAIEKVLAKRRARVKEVCAKNGLGPNAVPGTPKAVKHPPTPNYDIFYVDRTDQLAWCPVYKAASTSWLYNFLTLAGLSESYVRNTKEQVSHVARRVWPPMEYQDAHQALKAFLKFMIVRHPFERLVSAYRDKLENTNIGKENGVDHFYQKYGRKIVEKYRPPGQDPPKNRYSQDMEDPSIPPPKGIEPTFAEFVRYLIDTDLVYYSDDHWMPYYLHCTPCLVDYEVIAKFETLDRDNNYIIQKSHLEKKIKPSWKHLTKGKKTSDTVQKYFATITKTELMKLYDKYKLDFDLFGYSVDEYLDYVKQSVSAYVR